MILLPLLLCITSSGASFSVDTGLAAHPPSSVLREASDSCPVHPRTSTTLQPEKGHAPQYATADAQAPSRLGGYGPLIALLTLYVISSILYQIYLSISRSNLILAMSPSQVVTFLREHEPSDRKRAANTRALLKEAASKLEAAGNLDGRGLFVLNKQRAYTTHGLSDMEFSAVMDAKVEAVQMMPVGMAVLLPGVALTMQLKAICGRLFLSFLRAYLGGPMTRYNIWWKEQSRHLAQDSLPVLQGVELTRGIPYQANSSQTLDMLMPTGGVDANAVPVIYAHGGGFVCCSSEILSHSLTPIVRAGVPLFSIDYPLAPEAPFPAAILSTLEAAMYVKQQTGSDAVQLLGDSAGGNLVTYAAALICDKELLARFCEVTAVPVDTWDLPQVKRVCSVYGFLDGESWKGSPIELFLDSCWQCYMGSPTSAIPRCLLDVDQHALSKFPETLLIVGASDPLVESTRVAHRCLQSVGVDVELVEYPGVHGFLGIPTQWSFGWWKLNSAPAMERIVRFLSGKDVKYTRDNQQLDFSIWCVALSHMLIVLLVMFGLRATYAHLH